MREALHCKLVLWGKASPEVIAFVFSVSDPEAPGSDRDDFRLLRVEVSVPARIRHDPIWQELTSRHRLGILFPHVRTWLQERGLPARQTARFEWAPRSIPAAHQADPALYRASFRMASSTLARPASAAS